MRLTWPTVGLYLKNDAAACEAWVELPEWEGEHRATLTVHDASGTATASVIFLATGSGRRPHTLPRG